MDKKEKKGIMKDALNKVKLVDAGVENKYGDDHCLPARCSDSKTKIYYPNLYLDLKEAPMLSGSEVEDHITLLVKAKVVSHSLRESEGKKNEDFSLEIRKIGVVSTEKS